MATSHSQPNGNHGDLKVVGRVLNTTGVVFLSICVALSAALYEDVSALLRTVVGVAIAAAMVAGGEALSRRQKGQNWWFPTTLMSAGYALAYFFSYSTFYVPGLHMLESPYLAWGLGLAIGAIGTAHGSTNKQLRWFTSVFTMVVTGHVLFHALSSAAVLTIGGLSIKVAALGCLFGTVWCASLSSVYKRLEARYTYGKDTEETANWLLHRVLHEAYFVFAALNAMALPLVLGSFDSAPIWWSIQAPALLALSWRSGNFFKHGVVALIWVAAAFTLLKMGVQHTVTTPVLLSVPLAGLGIGLAYRLLKSNWSQNLKVAGYCLYLYAGIALAILVPYLQVDGVWSAAMPFWMIEGLVLCGLGLALRDKFVHNAGFLVGAGALVLFALQFQTWTWGLVGPVVVCAYALSVAYSRIARNNGWDQTKFLPFRVGQTVSAEKAYKLEELWSWVGCLTLFAASFLLIDQVSTVTWWSIEAFVLIALGFSADKIGFRLQGLLAYGLAAGKLIVWDLSSGFNGWNPDTALTLYQAFQFGVLGASSLAASFLYFRKEAQLEAQANAEPVTAGEVAPHGDDTNNNQQ